MNIEKTVLDLITPLLENADQTKVQVRESANDDEVIVVIYATSEDTGRLIGKGGAMAKILRQVSLIISRQLSKKIVFQFESLSK